MIIKSVEVKNFRNFQHKKVDFDSLTFLKGDNGKGKSSLTVFAIRFALFGKYQSKLSELPNRNTNIKSCWVKIKVEYNDSIYIIKRKYPTALEIIKDNEQLKFNNSRESQHYLNKIFDKVEFFDKFRLIDNSLGINFLDEGQTYLKKTLFNLFQKMFNNVRDRLTSMKHERQVNNKDKAKVENHYPSTKRLKVIQKSKNKIRDKIDDCNIEIDELNFDINKYNNIIGKNNYKKERAEKYKNNLYSYSKCYICKRDIDNNLKQNLLKDINKDIIDANTKIKEATDAIDELEDIVNQFKNKKRNLNSKNLHLIKLENKLKNRIKLKDFIYTNKDVEIMKASIKKLDSIANEYLRDSLASLEPIINSILEKINFKVEFDINDNNKFQISLYKHNKKYNYKELSTGQRLILEMAFKLSLLIKQGKSGVIVADEGFSSLDESNLMHILKIFKNYPFQLIMSLHHAPDLPSSIKVVNLNELEN